MKLQLRPQIDSKLLVWAVWYKLWCDESPTKRGTLRWLRGQLMCFGVEGVMGDNAADDMDSTAVTLANATALARKWWPEEFQE